MICEKCRTEVSDEGNFCRECGNPLSEGKRSRFLVYKSLVVFEAYLIVILVVISGILYIGMKPNPSLPPPPAPKREEPPPKVYKKDVFWENWTANPEGYRGVLIQKGGIVSDIYKSKTGKVTGLKVDTVPIGAHGGWAGPIYVVCPRDVPKVGFSDIVQVKGIGAGEKTIIVGARPINLPALEADSIEIVSESKTP